MGRNQTFVTVVSNPDGHYAKIVWSTWKASPLLTKRANRILKDAWARYARAADADSEPKDPFIESEPNLKQLPKDHPMHNASFDDGRAGGCMEVLPQHAHGLAERIRQFLDDPFNGFVQQEATRNSETIQRNK